MQPSEALSPALSADALSPRADAHYLHLQASLPQWLGNLSDARRQALKTTQPAQPQTLQTLPTGQHQLLKTLNAAHWTAQSAVDQRLEDFKDASTFAEPLLKAALKTRFGLDLDVRTTFLRLYLSSTTPLFALDTGGARTWTVSLLDAALHNFEQKETEDDAYEAASTFITQPSASGQFDTLPQVKAKLSIAAFTGLCRELDIGAQYMAYLQQHLGFSDPANAADLRQKIDKSQQAALHAALQFARMNRDISEGYFRTISALAEGLPHLRINGQPLQCHSLTMMAAPLTDIIVFAPPADEPRTIARVVAYVPDDPLHPIKEYASSAEMEVELTRQLRCADYQKFFSRFILHEQRGVFFSSLNNRLSRVTWHAPEPGSQAPAWRDTPFERPDLQLAATPLRLELWEHLYQGKLNKILNDARVIAVATATVDSRARWALWDSFVGIASAIVQTAAFIIAPFVPVLGEMMMAYMAYQFLDEVFEGIVDWAMGQSAEAIQHLIGTVESLIQLGGFAVGGAIAVGEFRKVLPKEIVAFIDRFNPVRMPDGQTRYWQPDLGRYAQNIALDAQSRPNELGLHQYQQKQLLPLDNAHFAVSEGQVPGQYRIEHPSRSEAYQPLVRHNGDGAWHSELEQPLEWDTPTALRRIGHSVESLTPAQRERVLHISGVDEHALRQMHADQQALPPLLADSIARFTIDQDLQRFIEQLGSESAEQYCAADATTQLQLLSEHGRWPADKRLRLINQQGEVIWQSTTDETLPVTDLHADNLIEGDLLKTLLQTLDEQDAKALLGEAFADADLPLHVRSHNLRRQLLQHANAQRSTLFESRYRDFSRTDDPLLANLSEHAAALPAAVTEELLNSASGDELLLISEGQVSPRQQILIQLASEEVRVTRAFEGLELDSVNNPDTDTLALHSLRYVPGWTGEVRVEIRDGRYEGTLLDSTGRTDAPEQKVLVRQDDGRYQPFDDRGQELHSATDFYSSILYALPDAERQSMNLLIGQTEQLKTAIRTRPLAREELRVAMSLPTAANALLEGLRLVGRRSWPDTPMLEGGEPAVVVAPLEPIQLIYRDYTANDAQEFALRYRHDPLAMRNELHRLRSELSRLQDDLRLWETQMPPINPANGMPWTVIERRLAKQSRTLFRNDLERCWRRQTRSSAGYLLQIKHPIIGDLPVLNADFSHVVSLSVNGSPHTGGVNGFLQQFAQLRHLDMQNLNLGSLPPAISAMPHMQNLILRDCGISLPADNQLLFSPFSDLSLLDLQGNPLGVSPQIQAMPSLRFINLAKTGIAALPNGLLDHPRLITGRFIGNQLTDIPDAFFNLAPVLSEGFSFADNPLSPASRERVKAYFKETKRHFGVVPEAADVNRLSSLFPDLDTEQTTEVLYQLPGTLVDGRAQLAAWESEVSQLHDDLALWSNNIPERAPETGQLLTFNEQVSERLARQAFNSKLEKLWRQGPPLAAARNVRLDAAVEFIGDMPVLRADFSHVREIILDGNPHVTALLPFLQQFQDLNLLELNFFDLEPATLPSLDSSQLLTLRLKNCGVLMTPQTQAALCAMPQLQILELRGNPLGTFFDLNLLPSLKHLDLSASGLSELPPGLADGPYPRTVLLSENNFVELPDALFAMPAEHSEGINLADNSNLSAAARNRIESYYRNTGNDFSVLADPADIDLARKLFPSLDTIDASEMIYDLPGTLADSRAQLQTWSVELDELKQDLRTWALQVPVQDPLTTEALDAIEMYNHYTARTDFAQQLQHFWQSRSRISGMREDQLLANLTFSGEMPPLRADFSHVSSVHLMGNAGIADVSAFIQLFPHAEVLELHNFALGHMPASLGQLPQLKKLTLGNCAITLTPEGQTLLHSLSDLEYLDLGNNPLGLNPDLTPLPTLNDVRLYNCGITEVPNGLVTHPNLRNAQLNGNAITDLPEDFFALDIDLADGIDLANNPLSTATRDRIKHFYAGAGYDIGVLPDLADITTVQSLFPGLSIEDATQVIYRLPGTLADGSAQLARWQTEVTQMLSDLAAWSERVPTGAPGLNMSAVDRAAQRVDRRAFSRTVEWLWRSRQTSKSELRVNAFNIDLTVVGELPTLNVDFSHVSQLALQGNERLIGVDGFLNCFTGLEALEMRRFALGQFPASIARMSRLRTLALTSCGIVFDESAQAALSSLAGLRGLDMYNNPLGRVPQVAALKTLDFIDLSRTGIDQLPTGLHELPNLKVALFSENHIRELPEGIFQLPDEISTGFDLDHNPLTAPTRERIKTHFQEHGIDFGVSISDEDQLLARTLYPLSSDANINEIVYGLPGTLAEGRVELMRRQIELATMVRDLQAWTQQVPILADNPLPLDAETLRLQRGYRDQFKARLEYSWRQVPILGQTGSEFIADLPILGELPTLSADFSHIQTLRLNSSSLTPARVGRFLEHFPNLQSLTIQGYRLGDLPEAVLAMDKLRSLSLPHCHISLSQQTGEALANLKNLYKLELHGNLLGRTPDVSQMQGLAWLNLSDTGITEIPAGLFNCRHLHTVDLSLNSISQVPVEVLSHRTTNFNFSGNVLSEISKQRLTEQRLAREHELMMMQEPSDGSSTTPVAEASATLSETSESLL